MKNLLFILIAALLIGCENKDTVSDKNSSENQIIFGKIDSIQSDILDENRKV